MSATRSTALQDTSRLFTNAGLRACNACCKTSSRSVLTVAVILRDPLSSSCRKSHSLQRKGMTERDQERASLIKEPAPLSSSEVFGNRRWDSMLLISATRSTALQDTSRLLTNAGLRACNAFCKTSSAVFTLWQSSCGTPCPRAVGNPNPCKGKG